jgi:AraC family transcriptional regulator
MGTRKPHPLATAAAAAAERTARQQRQAALVARALAHVDAHLDQPLDAATLADTAALSRHHFHRVFLAYLGVSVGRYVTLRRLQRACALLASGPEKVLEVALAVGYDSAQALAKALRREFDTTATAVRRGDTTVWTRLLPAWPELLGPAASPSQGAPMIQVHRHAELPAQVVALTATARGMVHHSMTRAASQAFAELQAGVARAGLMGQVRSCIALCPDDPQGPDDPGCRYVAGFVFGHDLARGQGACQQPALPLGGSLAWQALAPGRYAVFLHSGPYTTLWQTWKAIYRDWVPASAERLRDAPPLEVVLNDPETTPPEQLKTEIWLPLH